MQLSSWLNFLNKELKWGDRIGHESGRCLRVKPGSQPSPIDSAAQHDLCSRAWLFQSDLLLISEQRGQHWQDLHSTARCCVSSLSRCLFLFKIEHVWQVLYIAYFSFLFISVWVHTCVRACAKADGRLWVLFPRCFLHCFCETGSLIDLELIK